MLCKTRIKLREEIENGCRDVDSIRNDNLIDLAISYIEDFKEGDSIHESICSFLEYEDRNLYELKCSMAKSVIIENYDDLDNMFDEIHEDHLQEIHRDNFYKYI